MQASHDLHETAVPMVQAASIEGFHPADIRRTVLSERYISIWAQGAWHAADPQHLMVFEIFQREAMNVFQHLQAILNVGIGWGNKFEQGL